MSYTDTVMEALSNSMRRLAGMKYHIEKLNENSGKIDDLVNALKDYTEVIDRHNRIEEVKLGVRNIQDLDNISPNGTKQYKHRR